MSNFSPQFSGPYSKKVEELMKMARDHAKIKPADDPEFSDCLNVSKVTYVKEHLFLNPCTAGETIKTALVQQLVQLFELDAMIMQCRISIHTESTAICIDHMEGEEQQMLERIIIAANYLELQADYLLSAQSLFPEVLRSAVSRIPLEVNDFFYGYYTSLDNCEADFENAVVYGRRNGKIYSGMIPFSEAAQIDDRCWSCAVPGMICYVTAPEQKLRMNLEQTAKLLSELGKSSAIYGKGEDFSFELRDLELHNRQEILKFISLSEKMQTLADLGDVEECTYMSGFTDISGADPAFLKAEMGENGEISIHTAVI